jgi:hypothetical protein
MRQKRIQQIEQRVDRIKRALLEIGPMRPGSLTRQYKDPNTTPEPTGRSAIHDG